MYYEWHESEYVGGAHGYAGIFYYLLKLKHLPSVQQVCEYGDRPTSRNKDYHSKNYCYAT